MKFEDFARSGHLHHAYLVAGERGALRVQIEGVLERISNRPLAGNPDYIYIETKTFGIDAARSVKTLQSQKSLEQQFFVINAEHFTPEAQNALLKVLEEPTPHTHFFIVTTSAEAMLPTLRSRTVLVENAAERDDGGASEAKKFLASDPAARIHIAQTVAEKKDDARARALIDGMEKLIAAALRDKKSGACLGDLKGALADVRFTRTRLERNQAHLRMLLENLALVVPVIDS